MTGITNERESKQGTGGKPPVFVPRDVLLEAFRDAPAIDAARFREDVDAILDQDIVPRWPSPANRRDRGT